jgi:hypothetical protein
MDRARSIPQIAPQGRAIRGQKLLSEPHACAREFFRAPRCHVVGGTDGNKASGRTIRGERQQLV